MHNFWSVYQIAPPFVYSAYRARGASDLSTYARVGGGGGIIAFQSHVHSGLHHSSWHHALGPDSSSTRDLIPFLCLSNQVRWERSASRLTAYTEWGASTTRDLIPFLCLSNQVRWEGSASRLTAYTEWGASTARDLIPFLCLSNQVRWEGSASRLTAYTEWGASTARDLIPFLCLSNQMRWRGLPPDSQPTQSGGPPLHVIWYPSSAYRIKCSGRGLPPHSQPTQSGGLLYTWSIKSSAVGGVCLHTHSLHRVGASSTRDLSNQVRWEGSASTLTAYTEWGASSTRDLIPFLCLSNQVRWEGSASTLTAYTEWGASSARDLTPFLCLSNQMRWRGLPLDSQPTQSGVYCTCAWNVKLPQHRSKGRRLRTSSGMQYSYHDNCFVISLKNVQ